MNEFGFGKLLTDGDNNPKTMKSNKAGDFITSILHLAPAKSSGIGNVCTSASPGCIASCLFTAGRGRMQNVQVARIAKTKMWFEHREKFVELLIKEIGSLVKKAAKLGKLPALRLNGTSDIIWEKQAPELFTLFPTVQFYDYTKHVFRCGKNYKLPVNYHLTFSRSETNDAECKRVIKAGKCNVAVVFENKNYPPIWMGRPTYSMDDTDLRFLDPPKSVGALYAKGKAKKDNSGFVLPVYQLEMAGAK